MINEKSEQTYSVITRPEMTQFLPNEYSKVLEIGCNTGNFVQYLSKPYECWGIEPFEEAANVAKTKMDKVLIGFYDKVANEIPNNYFDLVIANDVIEHMENPWDFLQFIKGKMTTNASIVLSIPNVRYYDNLKNLLFYKDWKYVDAGILDITHLRFFTEKSITRLLNENGFEIEYMVGINSIKIRKRHLPIYWLAKFIFGTDIEFLQFGVRAKIK
ncbi:MAG: class I SAM-dependent methyltransferase [Fibromonadaceae bacterium]|jgi:2-polyprenyl-3-methyl-5-hydroxy-6-metoxy-1,4-benzoquinol methylase|nr:class I SAM-dependent methyltransferase [Fibromonadaceae bacterium]